MTKQESFKTRVRSRMATTGERYLEARRVLLQQSDVPVPERHWVSEPELSDEAILSATGKGWNEWCEIIDGFGGRSKGHKAIASTLRDEHDVGDWWAQGVTVGYERITGLRLPHQMADGTFTANKSRTINIDAAELRRLLLDDDERDNLFPNIVTELKSKPTSRAIRIMIGPGTAIISVDEQHPGRTKIAVGHEQLSTFDEVQEWKFYWSDWLDAIDEASQESP